MMRSIKPFWTKDELDSDSSFPNDSLSWLENYRRQLNWIRSKTQDEEDLTKEFTTEF